MLKSQGLTKRKATVIVVILAAVLLGLIFLRWRGGSGSGFPGIPGGLCGRAVLKRLLPYRRRRPCAGGHKDFGQINFPAGTAAQRRSCVPALREKEEKEKQRKERTPAERTKPGSALFARGDSAQNVRNHIRNTHTEFMQIFLTRKVPCDTLILTIAYFDVRNGRDSKI